MPGLPLPSIRRKLTLTIAITSALALALSAAALVVYDLSTYRQALTRAAAGEHLGVEAASRHMQLVGEHALQHRAQVGRRAQVASLDAVLLREPGPGGEHAAACGMSLCHGWSAAPTWALPAHVLGVRPTAPGFREVLIQPQPCDLSWADGTVPTPQGSIRVSWRRSADEFMLTIELPADTTAVVILPPSCRGIPQANGIDAPGELVLRAGHHEIRSR